MFDCIWNSYRIYFYCKEKVVMKKYCSRLDLLRFLAALAVAFFFHYVIVFGDSPLGGNIVGDALNKYGDFY